MSVYQTPSWRALCAVVCSLCFVGCSSSKESPAPSEASPSTPQVKVEEGVKSASEKSVQTAPAQQTTPTKEVPKGAQDKSEKPEEKSADSLMQTLDKQPYTLTYRAPVKGDRQTRTTMMNMAMSMRVEGTEKRFDLGKDETRTSKLEVLDTTCAKSEDCVISKVRVEYVSAKLINHSPMGSKEKSEPTVGNTYTVSVKNKELLVEDVAGKPVDAKVLTIIKRDHRRLGEGDITRGLFPWGETMKPGDVYTPEADAMSNFMRATKEDQMMDVGQASLTFLGFRSSAPKREAVFALKIPVEAEVQKGAKMTMSLAGNIVLQESTGWMVDLDVKSPFRVDLKQKDTAGQLMKISGTGEMKMGIDMEYVQTKTP